MFDHIERHLTEAVNEARKVEFWPKGDAAREAIRGKKFLLLKKRRRLHWRHRREFDELFELNRRLQVAHMLKEQFDEVWGYRTEVRMGDGSAHHRLNLGLARGPVLQPGQSSWPTS